MSRKRKVLRSTSAPEQDLIFQILKRRISQNGLLYGEGVLEVLPDASASCAARVQLLPCRMTLRQPSQIALRSAQRHIVAGQSARRRRASGTSRAPRGGDQLEAPDKVTEKTNFETSRAAPNRRPTRDRQDELNMRIVDMVTPIGFGQRMLIVAPADRQDVLLQKWRTHHHNHPDAYVIILLIDERRGSDRDAALHQGRGHQLDFDEPASRHVQVAEMVIDKARRLVEYAATS